MQSGRVTLSPTVVDTTTDKPAAESAAAASLYFCPTTSGCEAALATTLPYMAITMVVAVTLALTRTALFTSDDLS